MNKNLLKNGFEYFWQTPCDNCKQNTLYYNNVDKYFKCDKCKISYKIDRPRFTCDTNRIILKNPTKWINMSEYMDNDTKKRILMCGVILNINNILNNNSFKDWEIDKVYEWFSNSKHILNADTINAIQLNLNNYENWIIDLNNIKFEKWK